MSVELLELAAAALDDLVAEVVFVGGATVGLWITDPGAPATRPTKDVDVVVELATLGAYYSFEERLRARRFQHDLEGGLICRWRHAHSDLILDAMPAEASILGFENRWQAAGLPFAIERTLPSGRAIRALSPPYLFATKVEAFKGRGRGDFLGSRDFADIVTLVDGREELVGEIADAGADLRSYLSEEIAALLASPRIRDGVFGALLPDAGSQQRAGDIVLPALRSIVETGA